MENKSDVRAMRARFQTGGSCTEESSSPPVGRIKSPLQPTLSGPAAHKKPVLESLSASGINVKPSSLKSTPSSKSDSDAPEANKIKAMANRFAQAQDDSTNKPSVVNKVPTTLKPHFPPPVEAKGPGHPSPLNKPSVNSTPSDPKPVFPKPPSSLNSKPNWMKEDSGGGTASNATTTPPKMSTLQPKPISGVRKMWQQSEEQAEANTDTVNKPSPHVSPGFKPPSNFRTAQNMFNKEKDTSEQKESGPVSKSPFTASNTAPPPKPPANKKPSIKNPARSAHKAVDGDAAGGPKRNPLPNNLALGPPPAKPNRPPKVDLANFKRGAEPSENGPAFKKPIVPTPSSPHLSNQSNHVTQAQPPPPALPNLPPRHPATMHQDDVYDDVDGVAPPPLPSDHPSKKPPKDEIDDDEEGDMYEDLDERWEKNDESGKSQEKKKDDKEEKKRQEAAKKEQKEREKKEQDARKKFKLSGPLEVIQKGKALSDCKGGKTDLAVKQGDQLDIIRVQGNPEGKWLARSQDGSIGYVKTTSVEIDFNSLKNQSAQQGYDPEVYDDIDVFPSENSGTKGPPVVLPPPPGEDGEIYDDVVDQNLEVRVPPPSQFTADGNSDKPGAAIDEEIYDDVDAPPPPPLSNLPGLKAKSKAEEMDSKKQKKEEKEFRKKFKYEGEIHVLYQVNIISSLNIKKWSGKDLPVKAGEKLDVIVRAQDNKLICRNDDGKFGYVSTSHVVDDGEIYDDVGGDDCIYDND